jgi:hypothetical protein
MTISAQSVRDSYNANGVQTVWNYTFGILTSTDVHVYVRDADGVETEITSNFTIDTALAQVTYPSVASLLPALATGNVITLIREVPATQAYTGAVTAAVMESAFDKVTMILQEHQEKLTRCVQFQVNDEPSAETVTALLAAATAAAASAAAAAASAAGLNLPALVIGDIGKVLQVNATYDGYQTASMLTNPLTTSGDIVYAVDATPTRLPKGTATQVLHSGTVPSWSAVVEADLTLADNTTGNVLSTRHGFTPKSPADATYFLNGAATPAFALVKDSDLSLSDITTNDVSTTKHGFAPKAPNDPTKFLDGTGAYSVPTAVGTGRLLRVTVFTASDTWTKGAGTRSIIVEVQGGGAGGQSGGTWAGGGGGGYAMKRITNPSTSETVTIGGGGLGGTGAGIDTTFGSLLTGSGGHNLAGAGDNDGGAGVSGDINIKGGRGAAGIATYTGAGGNSKMGFGGPSAAAAATGFNGTGYGGGGGGGTTTGGNGTGGCVIVWEYA